MGSGQLGCGYGHGFKAVIDSKFKALAGTSVAHPVPLVPLQSATVNPASSYNGMIC